MATPVDTIYSQRSEFIFVALTGITVGIMEIVYLDPYTEY